MKKLLLTGIAALFLATGTIFAQAEDDPTKWKFDGHSCAIRKYVAGEDNWEIKPADIPDLKRHIKAFEACDKFYDCVARRDGYPTVEPKGKRPKHCYAVDKRWR
jgi:hypothetical protein